ncbi:MAG: histidine phosphatase family protein [Candidatus Shapirobacteria bacterium]
MKVFFVRHGSTDSLEKRISQPNDEPLNGKGVQQSKNLARKFSKTKFDLVISSPHVRALETANILAKDVLINDLFAEVRKPNEVIGQSKDDENIRQILRKIGEMYSVDPSWHYSDEENFEDLKNRGIQALDFLKLQNKENILVVSHGNFIALMIGLMMFGDDYPVKLSLKLKNFFRLSSTGVTTCIWSGEKWSLETWNDISHRSE